jgi:isocitrate dehydrogenase kinase/phosphatase
LAELLKLQRTFTGGTKFTKTSVEAAARMLKKHANVKRMANTSELAQLLPKKKTQKPLRFLGFCSSE